MKESVIGVDVRLKCPGPFSSNSVICSMIISLSYFLKYFVRKNWRGGDELLLKNGTIDGYANQPCFFLAGFK